MATAHGMTRQVTRIKFDDCGCGYQGFEKENDAVKFRLLKQANGEPAEMVKCPVGQCWHVYNPGIRPKEAYLKLLIDGRFRVSRPVPNASHPTDAPNVLRIVDAPKADQCSKIAYGTQQLAEAVLADAKANGRSEERAYQCDRCKKWHLTSRRSDTTELDEEELMSFIQGEGTVHVTSVRADGDLVGLNLKHSSGGFVRVAVKNLAALKVAIDLALKTSRA